MSADKPKEAKRGGPREGAGRKPKHASGELMKTRPVRMLDCEWDDAKFIGMTKLRELVTKEAARVRRAALTL